MLHIRLIDHVGCSVDNTCSSHAASAANWWPLPTAARGEKPQRGSANDQQAQVRVSHVSCTLSHWRTPRRGCMRARDFGGQPSTCLYSSCVFISFHPLHSLAIAADLYDSIAFLQVMTKGNTLLNDKELRMLVVLRMNRKFIAKYREVSSSGRATC